MEGRKKLSARKKNSGNQQIQEEKRLKKFKKISFLDFSELYLRIEAKKYVWYYPKSIWENVCNNYITEEECTMSIYH